MYIPIVEPIACCRALGDTTRFRIMRLLATTGDEACLCELEKSLSEPGYKLSRHLKILRDAGLLEAEKEGRWVYHRITRTPEFLGYLREFVKAIPDVDGLYEEDLTRFEEGKECRIGGRCRGGDTKTTEETSQEPQRHPRPAAAVKS
jgi:ArsR family transcriptional regulator